MKNAENVVLFCHQNADPDAVCSAIVLQSLIRSIMPGTKVEVCCPGGISMPTKQLLENLGYSQPAEKIPGGVDMAVLVDTNTVDQLGENSGLSLAASHELVVVDHHHPHPETEKLASLMIVDESAAAAAEVVFNLVAASKKSLARPEANALLAALFVETKHFLLARKSTFLAAAGLVDFGGDPRYLSEALSHPLGRSERVARLKAASRGELTLLGNWIVVVSELGSYQSSAARAFLGLGAHLAFVGGQVKDRVRVNMRATEDFYNKTGVHLGRDIAIPIGQELHGGGGGHPTAAGLSVPGEAGDVLRLCVEKTKASLGLLQT